MFAPGQRIEFWGGRDRWLPGTVDYEIHPNGHGRNLRIRTGQGVYVIRPEEKCRELTMKKIVVAIPHSHTWLWTQTCIASLVRNPLRADGYGVEMVVVDNSPWSPAIKGVTCTNLAEYSNYRTRKVEVIQNHKSNKFHASALDCVVEDYDFDLLMALETDVMALRPGWLQWFVDQMKDTDYAVGMWHHEQFVNPSCTLYRGDVLRDMAAWCRGNKEPNLLRWGPLFGKSQPIHERQPERDYLDWYGEQIEWIAGPFAEKRGWPAGTVLKESPSGQNKGVSWYEPGQQLHHWAVNEGYTYTVCPTHTHERQQGMPVQTVYGDLDKPWPNAELKTDTMALKGGQTVHFWGGTRALDIIKHDVTCGFVKANTPYWLAREARLWKETVPADVQAQTLDLIRQYGFHYTGQGNTVPGGNERDRAAVEFVRQCYCAGGIEW